MHSLVLPEFGLVLKYAEQPPLTVTRSSKHHIDGLRLFVLVRPNVLVQSSGEYGGGGVGGAEGGGGTLGGGVAGGGGEGGGGMGGGGDGGGGNGEGGDTGEGGGVSGGDGGGNGGADGGASGGGGDGGGGTSGGGSEGGDAGGGGVHSDESPPSRNDRPPSQLPLPLCTTASVASTYPLVAAKKNCTPRDAWPSERPSGELGRSDALPTAVPVNVCASAPIWIVDATTVSPAGRSGNL